MPYDMIVRSARRDAEIEITERVLRGETTGRYQTGRLLRNGSTIDAWVRIAPGPGSLSGLG
jgi:hypothetical protein